MTEFTKESPIVFTVDSTTYLAKFIYLGVNDPSSDSVPNNEVLQTKDQDMSNKKADDEEATFKNYVCEVCAKKYGNQHELDQHCKEHNKWREAFENAERPFTCLVCWRSFSAKSNLDRHYYIHSRVTRYTCNVCEKKFYRNDMLRRHYNHHYI